LAETTGNQKVPHVIIVGGGFGGLYAARALGNAPLRVTLIDRRNYHLFRPLLYQVATGLLSADEIARPIRSILSRYRNIEVLMSEVTGIDKQNRLVHLPQGDLQYDFLILATGITYNYFGHDNWQPVAPGLESLDDAEEIRARILSAFETAERIASFGRSTPEAIDQSLTFVLVGGGTVGVELASTIAEMVRMTLPRDFRHIDTAKARILLYEAASRLLPTFPESLSSAAQQHLERLGVTVHVGTHVDNVDSESVTAGGKRILTRTVLWCAGVVASPAGKWLDAEMDKSGKVKVGPDLSVPGSPNVFVIGDTASVAASSRNLVGIKSNAVRSLPGVAQPAIQEGEYVADVIRRRVQDRPSPEPFWYWDKGDLAIVGRAYALADLRFLRLSGFLAWLLWMGVHIYFLIGFPNRLFVLLQWGISFLTKARQARIFPALD
jgi:NADH:quinone reductase (non-electrogenic)